jgi:hypothetical protein
MSIEESIEAFKNNRLEIDCVDMTLRQVNEDNPIVYRGKGTIRQTVDGKVSFKLFVNRTENNDKFVDLKRFFAAKSGEILPEDNYYSLSATAFDRTVWGAGRLLIHAAWPVDGEPIVTGDLSTVSTEWEMSEPSHYLRLHFLEAADIPCVVDTYKFSAGACDFEVRSEHYEFTIEATSKQALDAYFQTRIQEALRFLLAKSVTWRIMLRQDGLKRRLELASTTPRAAKTRLDPPIGAPSHSHIEDSWRLFSNYLTYVIKNSRRFDWHVCSYHLHNACEASANSLDAWAVGLSVAVEGIASLIQVEKSNDELEELAKLQEYVLKHINLHESYGKYSSRLKGLLNMMMNVRVQDRLRRLEEQGYVGEGAIDAWSSLRNRHVHPDESELRSMEPEYLQRLFDRINKVTVLMYNVVFALIDYEGTYTDYGSRNYPTRNFPLAPRTELHPPH